MLSLPVLAGLEQGADLLASPRRADRAEHQRISGRRQIRLAVHRCTARDPLAPTDIVERARPQTVRLELAREPLPRRTGAPDVERLPPQRTAGEIVRAQSEHRGLAVRSACARETRRRIPPLQ